MADRVAGFLEVGTNGAGEVVINHPRLVVDAEGVGHIVFSPGQARALADQLRAKADEAAAEARYPGRFFVRAIQSRFLYDGTEHVMLACGHQIIRIIPQPDDVEMTCPQCINEYVEQNKTRA